MGVQDVAMVTVVERLEEERRGGTHLEVVVTVRQGIKQSWLESWLQHGGCGVQ